MHLPAFEASDVGLRRLHATRQLCLRQPDACSRLDERTRELKLLAERISYAVL